MASMGSKIAVFVGIALCGCAAGAANLLENADFSKLDAAGNPEGWRMGHGVSAVKDGGRTVVRLQSDDPSQYVSFSRDVTASQDWDKLRLGARMRVNKVSYPDNSKPGQTPRAMLVFTDIDGKKHFRPMCHLSESTNGKWFENWGEIEMLPDILSVGVVFDLNGFTGEFDVADIQLLVNPPTGLPLSALDSLGRFEVNRRAKVPSSPPGWVVPYNISVSDDPAIRIESENGRRFVRVANDKAGSTVMMEQFFRVDPSWKEVKISARIRTRNLQPGQQNWEDARVMFTFADDRGSRAGGYGTVPNVREDQDWKVMSATREVPEGATAIRLGVGLFNTTGVADFADIKVEKAK